MRSFFWSVFPVFGLNTEIYSVNLVYSPNTEKYEPEKTLYLDTFGAKFFAKYWYKKPLVYPYRSDNKKNFKNWTTWNFQETDFPKENENNIPTDSIYHCVKSIQVRCFFYIGIWTLFTTCITIITSKLSPIRPVHMQIKLVKVIKQNWIVKRRSLFFCQVTFTPVRYSRFEIGDSI